MVTIRLSRGGSKKRPFYHILVADQRRSTKGRFIERIGYYNPMLKEGHDSRLKVNIERADSWISKGARPTESVARLLGLARKQVI